MNLQNRAHDIYEQKSQMSKLIPKDKSLAFLGRTIKS
jgi:hypothetical protein